MAKIKAGGKKNVSVKDPSKKTPSVPKTAEEITATPQLTWRTQAITWMSWTLRSEFGSALGESVEAASSGFNGKTLVFSRWLRREGTKASLVEVI